MRNAAVEHAASLRLQQTRPQKMDVGRSRLLSHIVIVFDRFEPMSSKQSDLSQPRLSAGLKPLFTMRGHKLAVSSVKYDSLLPHPTLDFCLHRCDHGCLHLLAFIFQRFFHRFSPCSRYLLSTSSDQTLLLWDATNGKCLRQFVGHTRGVNDVSWGADGSFFASASDDTTVRIWDVEYGRCVDMSLHRTLCDLTLYTGSF